MLAVLLNAARLRRYYSGGNVVTFRDCLGLLTAKSLASVAELATPGHAPEVLGWVIRGSCNTADFFFSIHV